MRLMLQVDTIHRLIDIQTDRPAFIADITCDSTFIFVCITYPGQNMRVEILVFNIQTIRCPT